MFLSFVAELALLSFLFWMLLWLALVVIIGPLWLALAFLSRNRVRTDSVSTGIINQCLMSVMFAGFIATASAFFVKTQNSSIQHSWLYAVWGFIAAYAGLSRINRPTSELTKVVGGFGILAGLVAYPVFYIDHQAFSVVPGGLTLSYWAIRLADLLTGFLLVRMMIFLAALGYLFKAGVAMLYTGLALLKGIFALLKGSRLPRRAVH